MLLCKAKPFTICLLPLLCLCYSRMENNALTGRQNIQPGVVGGLDKVWERSLPFKAVDSICSEPHLEVDSDMQPNRVPIQESRQS